MPTFYSKAVTIQVSVANLARTTTLGIPSSHSIEHIQRVFAEESVLGTLFENPVHSDAEDEGPLLQFLGESVPLYMRQVGKNFFDINAKKNRYIWPKRVPDGVEVSWFLVIPSLQCSDGLIWNRHVIPKTLDNVDHLSNHRPSGPMQSQSPRFYPQSHSSHTRKSDLR